MSKGFKKSGTFGGNKNTFFIILAIIALVVLISMTGLSIPGFVEIKGAKEIKYGIDIKGGFEVYLQPSSDHKGEISKAQLEAAKKVVELRLDGKGITDRDIYLDGSNRIIVRAPLQSSSSEDKTNEILELLGEMALLTFRDPDGKVVIDGSDVEDAYPQYNPDTGKWVVTLKLHSEGKEKFAEATGRLIGKPIAIYMDETEISAPTVDAHITDGNAIIQGVGDLEYVKDLANKIKAGSLPFAMEVVSKNIISASLGNRALDTMITATVISLILISLFMIIYYKLPGFVAVLALLGQTAGQLLAISVPGFTLTLPGIAAIILSIGMAVDANVIISERIKEEVNAGNPLSVALRHGFDRAASAIIDGNVTTAFAAILLIIFGTGTFLSFGYSLLTGIVLNIVFGVVLTRLMTTSLGQYDALQNKWLYGGKKVKQ